MKRLLVRLATALFAYTSFLPELVWADDVHVITCQDLNGTVSQLSDEVRTVSSIYVSDEAVTVNGYIFIGWSISTEQQFASRDEFGRALDSVSFPLYEATTLTAHYVPSSIDADGDGLSDGWELYWFGDLMQMGVDDPDGDGYANSVEFAQDTNPLLKTRKLYPGIVTARGEQVVYNPYDCQPLTIRSEPEGALFATSEQYVKPGDIVTTQSYDPEVTTFAYWMVDGVRQEDGSGRALDFVAVEMGNAPVEIVAVCIGDTNNRLTAYWYGQEIALDSDTDNDGYAFTTEIANGTNPTLKSRKVRHGIVTSAGGVVQYNPNNLQAYVIRSEPDGELFATISDYAKIGDPVATASYSSEDTTFAYWTVNGVRQSDEGGRALDSVVVTMQNEAVEIVAHCLTDEGERMSAYWYGGVADPNADTDGDGYAFSTELQLGMNPLLKTRRLTQGIVTARGDVAEINLQQFKQQNGAVFDGEFSEFSILAMSGLAVVPLIADLNGDGLFDMIIVSAAATNVFVNVGSAGNPSFVATNGISLAGVDWATNDVSRLEGLSLDVAAPVDALACAFGDADQDGVTDLLVSDAQGRIWYYKGTEGTAGTEGTDSTNYQLSTTNFQLQHKVWGGTYAGFAQGLRIAAVDWDADGDLDCLCGTADGKLMLLLDPGAGRPTGLTADAGVDSVNLSWNASRQSRVRGYNVYRSPVSPQSFVTVASPELPSHRDVPPEDGTYAYRVTTLSRHYVAGNSEPMISESKPSEAVSVDFGTAQFYWRLAVEGDMVDAQLIVRNSSGLGGNLQLRVGFNPSVLTPVSNPFVAAAIAPNFNPSVTKSGNDTLIVSGPLGEVVPDQHGVLFLLKFTKVTGADLEQANLTAEEFTIVSSGHGTQIDLDLGETEEGVLLGDVNLDGTVDEADIAALKALLKKTAEEIGERVFKSADMNGDEKLDGKDVILLKRKVGSN